MEEYSENVGVDIAELVDPQTRQAWNASNVTQAQEAIRNRITKTSEQVVKQIPYCPMTPENVRVEVGDPQQRIVEVAQNEGFDLIILGAHGHGALENAFLGSVAQGVIRESQVPVLAVKITDDHHPFAGSPQSGSGTG